MAEKMIDFTCVECNKSGFTEATGMEMALGFVCTECLYATSEEVTTKFLNDPMHVGVDVDDLFVDSTRHPLEDMFPEGMTHEEAHNIQMLNDMGVAVTKHNREWLDSVTVPKKRKNAFLRREFFAALMLLAAILCLIFLAPEDKSVELCLDGAWTHDQHTDTFVCVKDDGTYYPPEG